MVEQLQADRPHVLARFGKAFFGAGLLGSPVSAGLLECCGAMALQASPLATLDYVRSFSETGFRTDLAVVQVPTPRCRRRCPDGVRPPRSPERG